jgi:carboxyl-terminal processing protease
MEQSIMFAVSTGVRPGSAARFLKALSLTISLMVVVGQPLAAAQEVPVKPAPPTAKVLSENTKARVLIRVQSILQKYAFAPGVDFEQLPDIIKAERENIDKAKTETEFVASVNSALRKYKISHISLFTPKFGEERKTQKKSGLGIRLEVTERGYVISHVVEGGGAEEAGLHAGDLIVSCDGKPVKTIDDLAGEDGQVSRVVVRRMEGGKEMEVTISVKRKPFSLVVKESLEMKGDVAVVTIPSFDNSYDLENVDKIMGQALKSKGIVLDLRNNGGGRVTNLLHLAGYFVPREQPIGKWVSRSTVVNYEKQNPKTTDVLELAKFSKQEVVPFASEGGVYKGAVAVLINGGTGSASEMMTQALVELRGAEVIGSKSAGAVLASVMREVEGGDGFWIQYPMLDYVSIKGYHLEGNGIKPKVERTTPRFGESDSGLEAALNWISTRAKAGS